MALEGTVLGSAGELALPELRRGQVRSAQIHAVQLQGRGGALRRGKPTVAAQDRRRSRAYEPVRHHGGRAPFDTHPTAAQGYGDFQGPLIPYVLLAARKG